MISMTLSTSSDRLQKLLHKLSKEDGFTLIELMIVVAIIAIILMLALPVYADYAIRTKIVEALSVANAAKPPSAQHARKTPPSQHCRSRIQAIFSINRPSISPALISAVHAQRR